MALESAKSAHLGKARIVKKGEHVTIIAFSRMVQLALEAASTGMGVAIGRRPLGNAELDSGTLVEAGTPTVVAQTAYWLVSAEGADDRPDLLAFKRWLLDEAQRFDE